MTTQKAIKLTIASRKPQKPTYYFSPDKKVKSESIKWDKGCVLDSSVLAKLYYEGKFIRE